MRYRARKCRCCRQWYLPQAHNAYHQRYCTRPKCRQASKRRSQRRWLRRNPDQNRGLENVLRVRAWRAEHPRYWESRRRLHRMKLDLFIPDGGGGSAPIRIRAETPKTGALQDLYLAQCTGLRDLASDLNDALRDLIGAFLGRCYVGLEAEGMSPA